MQYSQQKTVLCIIMKFVSIALNRIEKQLFRVSFWEFSNNDLIYDCVFEWFLCETLLNHIIRQINTSKLGFYPYTSLGPTALGMYMAKSLASRYLSLPYISTLYLQAFIAKRLFYNKAAKVHALKSFRFNL